LGGPLGDEKGDVNAPAGTSLTERTEWVFGLGEPRPPSRYGLSALLVIGALLGVGALLWYALSGGREEGPGYSTAAPLFLWMYVVAETGGSFLYARRGVWWGRGLRAFGSAAFFPLSIGFYSLSFWSASSRLGFAVTVTLLGIWVVGVAFRLVRLAWRRE
jgi:hypothetical protein